MGSKAEFYSRDKINKKYAKFLKGKKVVLVGPAHKTKGTLQKDMIDGYDIVVRMNLAFKIPVKIQKDVGTRVDVLYCALSYYYFKKKIFTRSSISKFKNNIKWIISTGIHRENILKIASYNKSSEANVGLRQVGREDVKFISKKLEEKPSVGVSTIYDLLKYDISELYLTGFTFYNFMVSKSQGRNKYYYDGYSPNYLLHAGAVFNHNIKKEAEFVKKLCEGDKRVKINNLLEDTFSKLK